ncbi:hypothetical protein KKC47_03530, partial [Patescibacteria group bacterium]|nr:hypothetical protein [Patescibacteria group bacterium]
QGKFLEWEENYGNLYGSERAVLEQMLERHSVVLVTLDVRGAKSYQKVYPSAIIVALSVPVDQILERITARAPIDSAELERRIEAVTREQAEIDTFDFIVENRAGQLETKTVPRTEKIILNELTKRQSSTRA